MFACCCCSAGCLSDASQKISPSDTAKNVRHEHIELKDNRKIHLIHVNGDLAETNVDSLTSTTKSQVESSTLTDLSKVGNDEMPVVKNQPTPQLNVQSKEEIIKTTIDFIAASHVANVELLKVEREKYSIHYKNRLNQLSRYKVVDEEPTARRSSAPKPFLFLIHGVGGCCNIWSRQLEYFGAKGYEIVAIDLIGHGESSTNLKESDFQFQSLASDILACFDRLARPNSVIVGHSYGCSFATYLAHFRKDKIKKIILISGASPYPLDYQSILLKAPVCFIKLIRPIINCHFFWYFLFFSLS